MSYFKYQEKHGRSGLKKLNKNGNHETAMKLWNGMDEKTLRIKLLPKITEKTQLVLQ